MFLVFTAFINEWTAFATFITCHFLFDLQIFSSFIINISYILIKYMTVWTYPISFSIFFPVQCVEFFIPEFLFILFGIHWIFHVEIHSIWQTIHIVVVTSISCICHRIKWQLSCEILISFHEWYECLGISWSLE